MLTYTALATAVPWQGALYLAAYGAGFVLSLVVLSLLGDSARSLVRRLSPWLPRLERANGVLLAGVGLFLIFSTGNTPHAALVPRADVPAAATQRRLAESYQVRGVPTFVFLDSEGNAVARLVGHQSLGLLRQSMSALVGEKCAGLGLFEAQELQSVPGMGSTCGAAGSAAQCGG